MPYLQNLNNNSKGVIVQYCYIASNKPIQYQVYKHDTV